MAEIKKITLQDLEGLKALYEDAFVGSYTDIEKLKARFDQVKENPDYVLLVAKIEESVVGSVLGIVCQELFGQCRPFMVLEDVAVARNCRRMGIARQLLLTIEDYAREAGCSMILFVSSEHRTEAHKLYESAGYGVDKVKGYRKRLG